MIKPVIFCGIDGTGKTPLIAMVKKLWNSDDMKVIQPPAAKDPLLNGGDAALKYAAHETVKWIEENGIWLYDRFPYPDEFVYGDMWPNDLYRQSVVDFYSSLMGLFGTRVVYIEPGNHEKYMERMAQQPDEFFKVHEPGTFYRTIGKYEHILLHSRLEVLRIRGGRQLHEGDAHEVIRFITGA